MPGWVGGREAPGWMGGWPASATCSVGQLVSVLWWPPSAGALMHPSMHLWRPAGAVAADQVVNARKYVHHVWTAIVLALVTALFVVASLLPLLDPWATAAGLLTGEGGLGLYLGMQGGSAVVNAFCMWKTYL